ncbi:MAG: oligosaccharide flippase family protein [Rhodospirillaceae bacterium]|nr:oligosaccharide flippase family protein [Rhodospirillales bacterium]
MAGLRQVFANGAWFTLGSAFQALVAFAANLVLVRHLMPEQFGRFAVIQAGAGLVLSVLSLRMGSVIIRMPEAQLTPSMRERLFSVLTMEAVACLAVLAIWGAVSGMGQLMGVVLMVSMVLNSWTASNRAFYERGMDYRRLAAVETAVHLGGHIFAVALVIAGMGAEVLYLREMFFVVVGLLALARVGGLSWYRLRWVSVAEWRAVLRDVRGIWLDSMLENVHQRLVILVVNAVAGLAGAGLFFQAQRLAMVPHQFLMPLVGRVAGTWFGRTEDGHERRSGRAKFLMVLTPMLVLAAVLAWLLADPVVPWLFGPNWAPAAPLLVSLAGLIVFLSLFEVLRSYAVASKLIRLLLVARVMQFAGLLLPLAPVLWGGALGLEDLGHALSWSYALGFASLWLVLRRHERT